MIKIGVTERGDAGLDLSWFERLKEVDGAILITKNPNPEFAKKVNIALQEGHKLIVHVTCTGMGGTKLEPNVPNMETVYQYTKNLIAIPSMDVEHMVLRTDPVVPTSKGLLTWKSVAEKFSDLKIRRMRYSFLDMYEHVKERFKLEGIDHPLLIKPVENKILAMQDSAITRKGEELGYRVESCGEYVSSKVGCISEYDFKLFGIPLTEMIGNSNQRKSCNCCSNKYELLRNRTRCTHKCLYCYWKD